MINIVKGLESIILFTEDSMKLAKFYEDKVGLKLTIVAEMGEENEKVYGFEFEEGPGLFIMKHSKIAGKSKEPSRIMFNLEVDDIEKESKRLDENGVSKVSEIYHLQNYGLIATYEDDDGNYFQIVQVKAMTE